MKKRILCFVLTMAMVLSMLAVIPAATVTADSDNVNVGTRAELEAVATAVNAGTDDYSGKTVVLTADIDLSGSDWTSIGNSSNPFRGSFNGNGHTISNMTRSGGAIGQNVGLFGVVSSPDGGSTTIQNFKITGSIVSNKGGDNAGMVVSAVKPSTTGTVTVNITGVWSAVNFDAGSAKMTGVGGILGTIAWVTGALQTTINIDSCRYSGTMDSPSAGSNDYGGIFGYPKEACGPRTVNITNCLYDGVMYLRGSAPDDNGGIVGYFKGNGGTSAETHFNIENCIVAGQFHMPNKSGQTVTGYVVSEASGSGSTGYAVTNVYYCDDSDRHTGGDMGGWYGYYKGGSGSISGLITSSNVTAKTMTELKSMTSGSNFADDSKWHFGTSSELPVPAMIYDNIIANAAPGVFDDMTQSEFVISTNEEMAEFADLVNNGTTFAGKTIKLGADVALNGRIGATSSKPFSGNFDGQGHTVTITQSFTNSDAGSGLFSFIRVPADGSVTVENVHVTGTVSSTVTTDNYYGYLGGLIGAVDAGKSGNGGELNITNCWVTTRLDLSNTRHWMVGGLIGFTRHEDNLKPLTINIDSCLWDGIINSGPAISYGGGLIGYTGNNKAGRTLTINISKTVVAGTIMTNQTWDEVGMVIGYPRGANSDNATAKPTVNITDVVSVGKITYASNNTKELCGFFGKIDGTTELNLTNFYYKPYTIKRAEPITAPLIGVGEANTSTNVESKTAAEMLDLTGAAFTNSADWNTSEGYPCPVGIVNVFGAVPSSLVVDPYDLNDTFEIGTSAALKTLADIVNAGTHTYAGKTILITADLDMTDTGFAGIGITSSRPFSGNINGQGHTINITQDTLTNPDGNGGFIGFVRVPENSTVTIQNLHITGTIAINGGTDGKGYVGALIDAVDAGKSGNGGTLNITNCWSSVRFNLSGGRKYDISGFIAFTRHESGVKPLTINFDSCVWDGIINAGPALDYSGGFIGYTGNSTSGRTLNINVSNCVAAGSIWHNQTYSDDTGLVLGYMKGGSNDNCKITATATNVICVGVQTNSVATNAGKWLAINVGGTNNTEINLENFYYKPFNINGLGEVKLFGTGSANSSSNVASKTAAEMYALTTSSFTDSSKWTKTAGYYVCPADFVSTFGSIPETLAVDVWDISDTIEIGTVEDFIAFRDAVNGGKSMSGKTILLTADIDLNVEGCSGLNEWVEIGRGTSFAGTFDGQGHTIKLVSDQKWTSGYFDTKGGLFGGLNGAIVRNFNLTGTMNLHNNAPTSGGETDYIGSIAGKVEGTTLIQNVRSSVNITTRSTKNEETNTWPVGIGYVAGLVGFIPHNATATITIDGCTYAGTINAANQAKNFAGIMAFTGNGGTKSITISNCAFTGSMTLNENAAYAFQGVGGIFGYVKSGTLNITNTYSAGKIYFNRTKAWPSVDGDSNPVKAGQIIGYNEDGTTVNIDETVTYTPAYLYTEVADSKPVAASKYILPEAGLLNGTYAADTAAVLIPENTTVAEARNTNDAYKGIRFVATFYNVGEIGNAGNANANFGLFLMTKDVYDTLNADGEVTKAELVSHGQVVQVKATKAEVTSTYVKVSAVVFNLNTTDRKATEIVAVQYVENTIVADDAATCIATYNGVFN